MYSCLLLPLAAFALTAASCTSSPSHKWEDSNRFLDENGCYLVEEYDSGDDNCYLNCDNLNEAQCDALAFEVYADLDEFIDDDFDGSDNSLNEEFNDVLIASYSVESSLSLDELFNTEPENDETFQRIWSAVIAILPNSSLQDEVIEYHINTDGLDNTLAYVTLHETIPEKWVIAIDSADFTSEKDKEFIHTVIHEFAHIVFLNKSQVDIDTTQNCANYSFTEGCSAQASYINAFYSRFWSDIIKDNPSALADADTAEDEELAKFYGKYQTHFISEYAATNPIEDAAEIFVHFVLRNKPQNPIDIAQQKIAFLYQFPRLLKLRSVIRANLRRYSAT